MSDSASMIDTPVFTVKDIPLSPSNTWHGDPELKARAVEALQEIEQGGPYDGLVIDLLPALIEKLGGETERGGQIPDEKVSQLLGVPLWWPAAFNCLTDHLYSAGGGQAWYQGARAITEIPVGLDIGTMFATFAALRIKQEIIPELRAGIPDKEELDIATAKLHLTVDALTGAASGRDAFEAISGIRRDCFQSRGKAGAIIEALRMSVVEKSNTDIVVRAEKSLRYGITIRLSFFNANGRDYQRATVREVDRQVRCYQQLEAGHGPVDIVRAA